MTLDLLRPIVYSVLLYTKYYIYQSDAHELASANVNKQDPSVVSVGQDLLDDIDTANSIL